MRDLDLQTITNLRPQIRRFLIPLCMLIVGASLRPATPAQDRHPSDTAAQTCLKAAKKALGPEAEVFKCGRLTGARPLQAIVVLRLKQFRNRGDSIAVSKLVVLQQNGFEWNVELVADREWIRNREGYVGIDFIDDSEPVFGYRASFSDRRDDDVVAPTIYLNFLSPSGEDEGRAVEISWNPSLGRYQEFAYDQLPEEFKAELKNPPHIRTRKLSP